jgi:hypothetical protein
MAASIMADMLVNLLLSLSYRSDATSTVTTNILRSQLIEMIIVQ